MICYKFASTEINQVQIGEVDVIYFNFFSRHDLAFLAVSCFFSKVFLSSRVPGEYENEQNEVARGGQRYELYYEHSKIRIYAHTPRSHAILLCRKN